MALAFDHLATQTSSGGLSWLGILVFTGLLYLSYTHRDGRAYGARPRPDLSPITGIPLFGNLAMVLRQGSRNLERWSGYRENQRRTDPGKCLSMTLPGGLRVVDITSPSWIEWVQKGNFANYEKGELFHGVMKGLLGDGIFAADGDNWIKQRKVTSKIFNGINFRGGITAALHRDLHKLRTIVARHADNNEVFDLSALFYRFTLSSFAQMAFTQDVGVLSTETDAHVPFAGAFDFVQAQMMKRLNNPLWKLTERVTGTNKKMEAAMKLIDDLAISIVDQREQEGAKKTPSTSGKDKDLLDLYMELQDDEGQPLSRRALRDSVLNLLIAGRDTTAQAISWNFYHLIANPDFIAPLRSEADAVETVDFDSYKDMTATLASFHEGLRLHPSVPKNARIAKGDDQIPDGGPFIEAGTLVRWSDWEMARDTTVWGPDASQFRPSRWIAEDGSLKKESQWKAHMFNGGPRLCLGQQLATYEATAVISTILREFDLSFAPGWRESTETLYFENTPRYADSLTLPMKAPFLVKATRRA